MSAPPRAPRQTPALAQLAGALRRRHDPTDPTHPLVLPNVWDAASARAVVDAGCPVVATSSAAVAACLGARDGEQMDVATAFAAVARVARAVEVPVTADVEGGYGLPPAELVGRLLDAGAVGCNLEDTDHRGPEPLVAVERQVAYLHGVVEAAREAGVDVVVNARVDVLLRQVGPPEGRLDEAIRRGRAYAAAGAACVYPIGATAELDIARLVAECGAPVNVWLRPDGPPLARLVDLGVARVSLAAGVHRDAMARVREVAAALMAGDDALFRRESP